jgi:CheY-like chemotaxis protein
MPDETPPDLTGSDLSMPDMDGLELLTRIRSLPTEQTAPTPAIAFTGFANRENQAAARRAGFARSSPSRPTRSMWR